MSLVICDRAGAVEECADCDHAKPHKRYGMCVIECPHCNGARCFLVDASDEAEDHEPDQMVICDHAGASEHCGKCSHCTPHEKTEVCDKECFYSPPATCVTVDEAKATEAEQMVICDRAGESEYCVDCTHATPHKSIKWCAYAECLYVPSQKCISVDESKPLGDKCMQNCQENETRTKSETGGEKCQKLARYDLVPPAFEHALAEHFGKSGGDGTPESKKYEDRNWERGYNWSLCYQAMRRHVYQWLIGNDTDADTKTHHLICAAWHCAVMFDMQRRRIGTDDRAKVAGAQQ